MLHLWNLSTAEVSLDLKTSLKYVAKPYLKTLKSETNNNKSPSPLLFSFLLSLKILVNSLKIIYNEAISSLYSQWNPTMFLSHFCFSTLHVGASGHGLHYTTWVLIDCKSYELTRHWWIHGRAICLWVVWERNSPVSQMSHTWGQAEPLRKRANIACPWALPLKSAASWRCIWATMVVQSLSPLLYFWLVATHLKNHDLELFIWSQRARG